MREVTGAYGGPLAEFFSRPSTLNCGVLMGSGALVLRSTIPFTTRRRDTGVVPLARQTVIFGPCGRRDPALRRWTARRQYSGQAGWPSSGAVALDVGPVAPFPTTCCTSRPDDDARSYGRRKLARTFIATGPELAHTADRLRGSDFAGPSRDGAGRDARNGTRSDNPMGQAAKKKDAWVQHEDFPGALRRWTARRQYSGPAGWPSSGAAAHDVGPVAPFPTTCCTSHSDDDVRTFVATGPELAHTAARLRGSNFAGPSRDGAGRDARNGTRSDNPMGQAAKKKDAGVQHEDFAGAFRRWTARRQYSGPAGWPSGRAAAHDVGPIAPFPTTCCTSRPNDDARSYGRRKLVRTFVATGPELAHTAARLRGSDFAGPSRDGAGRDARNGTRSDNPMGQAAKKKDAGVQHEDFPRALRRWTARRSEATAHDVGPVAPFPTTCCTSRPDDDARSYRRRKMARTFVATGPELAHTAAQLRGSDFVGPSRDGAGRDSRNGTRSDNPLGQAAKKKDAGVQHEDFPGGHPS
ncbi:hypothetical protein ACLOJK_037101 [Asimina triloba]